MNRHPRPSIHPFPSKYKNMLCASLLEGVGAHAGLRQLPALLPLGIAILGEVDKRGVPVGALLLCRRLLRRGATAARELGGRVRLHDARALSVLSLLNFLAAAVGRWGVDGVILEAREVALRQAIVARCGAALLPRAAGLGGHRVVAGGQRPADIDEAAGAADLVLVGEAIILVVVLGATRLSAARSTAKLTRALLLARLELLRNLREELRVLLLKGTDHAVGPRRVARLRSGAEAENVSHRRGAVRIVGALARLRAAGLGALDSIGAHSGTDSGGAFVVITGGNDSMRIIVGIVIVGGSGLGLRGGGSGGNVVVLLLLLSVGGRVLLLGGGNDGVVGLGIGHSKLFSYSVFSVRKNGYA